MATIQVTSRLQNAVELRVHGAWPRPDIAGESLVKDTDRVTVRPGTNWVDAAFWEAWQRQHRGTDLAEHIVADDDVRPLR